MPFRRYVEQPIQTICFADFDGTLLDVNKVVHQDLRAALLRFFDNDIEFYEFTYAAARSRGWTLRRHVEAARARGVKLPLAEMEAVVRRKFSDMRRYLFHDVHAFLETAQRMGVVLALLSFGDRRWQEWKIDACGLHEFFSGRIFITEEEGRKDRVVLRHGRHMDRIIVIDDSADELDRVRELVPGAETFCIDRVSRAVVHAGDLEAPWQLGRSLERPVSEIHERISSLRQVLSTFSNGRHLADHS